jgi:hypothetical protein
MIRLKKYQEFLLESSTLWNGEEIPYIDKINSKILLMGIFSSISSFPGGYEIIESLFNSIQNIQKMKKKSIWDSFLPKLIYWENRLGNFVSSGNKGEFGKREKISMKTKSNEAPKVKDVYSNAYKKDPNYIDKCVDEFKKTIDKMNSSLSSEI